DLPLQNQVSEQKVQTVRNVVLLNRDCLRQTRECLDVNEFRLETKRRLELVPASQSVIERRAKRSVIKTNIVEHNRRTRKLRDVKVCIRCMRLPDVGGGIPLRARGQRNEKSCQNRNPICSSHPHLLTRLDARKKSRTFHRVPVVESIFPGA